MKIKKVLILGANGMLGSMVFDYLKRNIDLEVLATYREKSIDYYGFSKFKDYYSLDASLNAESQLEKILSHAKPDYIINCIGIIKPYCKDDNMDGVFKAIKINSCFPHLLSNVSKKYNRNCKIIQIATDCVFDGVKGKYNEHDAHNALDVYGKTKSLGEVISQNFLNIRCSIIGPERQNKLSLLEWFLSNEDDVEVNGFSHHLWNGITTLQFANLCEYIILNNLFDNFRQKNHVINYVINETVSKYELLRIICKVFNRSIIIKRIDYSFGGSVDRSLDTLFLQNDIIPMENAITDLYEYIIKNDYYNK